MSRYMDRDGYLRKDDPKIVVRIRRMERMLKEMLQEGASIPEALWAIHCTLWSAAENVRMEKVRGAFKSTGSRRSGSAKK